MSLVSRVGIIGQITSGVAILLPAIIMLLFHTHLPSDESQKLLLGSAFFLILLWLTVPLLTITIEIEEHITVKVCGFKIARGKLSDVYIYETVKDRPVNHIANYLPTFQKTIDGWTASTGHPLLHFRLDGQTYSLGISQKETFLREIRKSKEISSSDTE